MMHIPLTTSKEFSSVTVSNLHVGDMLINIYISLFILVCYTHSPRLVDPEDFLSSTSLMLKTLLM